MKRLTLIITFAFFLQGAILAQNLFVTLGGGMMNYGGDLQGKTLTFNQAHPAFTLGGAYYFNGYYGIAYTLTSGKVSGVDAIGIPKHYRRNLSFYSNIGEASVTFEANLTDIMNTEKRFTPYAFAGVAAFKMDPYTYDPDGNKTFLQPLSTEGQGLPQYPDKKPYKLSQIAFPFGIGVKYAVSEKIMISAEFSLRKIFTDYLDDVSGKGYADTAIINAEKGPLAAKLSFRGDELDPPYILTPKSQRGNPDKNDVYYTGLIKVSYSFGKSLFSF